jgi:hypothetical protein
MRRQPIQRVLTKFLDDEGGPLMYTLITEAEQRSFDSTCMKFRPHSVGVSFCHVKNTVCFIECSGPAPTLARG